MDAFWGALVPQLGPILVALFGLVAGLSVKSGRRRRLDNLKAGAETLAQLTEPQDQAAVRTYMAAQSAGLVRKLDLQFIYMIILFAVTLIGAPLLRASLHPDEPPFDYAPTFIGIGGIVVAGIVVQSVIIEVKKVRSARARRREESEAAPLPSALPSSSSS